MKKITIIAIMVMLLALAMAASSSGPTVVFAAYTHGDFASNSKGCADCHITHGANAAKLLVAGPTQTDTCYYCHSEALVSSRYNAETATVRGADNAWRASYAGGFMKSYKASNYTVGNAVYNTSVHSVEKSYQNGSTMTGGQVNGDIPGGGSWTGNFTCGSCHDPHAGGRYPSETGAPYKNPRLLRLKPLNVSTNRVVYMKIAYDYGVDGGASDTLLPSEYGKGWNAWCGACHDVFNTESNGGSEFPDRTGSANIDNGSGAMKYRHKMGVYLNTGIVFSTSLQDGLPLPTNTDGSTTTANQRYLNCLACHRAHGSSETVSVGFERFKSYTTKTGGTTSVSTSAGASALLRLPERDVCYKCHGAGVTNLFSGTDSTKYQTGW